MTRGGLATQLIEVRARARVRVKAATTSCRHHLLLTSGLSSPLPPRRPDATTCLSPHARPPAPPRRRPAAPPHVPRRRPSQVHNEQVGPAASAEEAAMVALLAAPDAYLEEVRARVRIGRRGDNQLAQPQNQPAQPRPACRDRSPNPPAQQRVHRQPSPPNATPTSTPSPNPSPGPNQLLAATRDGQPLPAPPPPASAPPANKIPVRARYLFSLEQAR